MADISRLTSTSPVRFAMPPVLRERTRAEEALPLPADDFTFSARNPRTQTAPRTSYQKLALGMVTLASGLGAAAGLMPSAAAALAAPAQQTQTQAQAPAERAPMVLTQIEETPDLPADPASANAVVQARDGRWLSQGEMLKYDNFPGVHDPRLQSTKDPQPQIPGAPNFRKVNGEETYGVAQPTVAGLKTVLNRLGAGPGGNRTVMWTTMRQEPVVYVHGRSLTLRQLAHPFDNMEQPGITAGQVEHQEVELKQEVMREAARFGGRLLVHDETPDGKVVARWVEIKPEDVQTPREVFDGLRSQGFKVDYARVPVTDEKAPDDAAVDAIVARARQGGPNQAMVFNCHAGKGRTTTAMVIADMVRHAHDPKPFLRQGAVRQDIREEGRYQRGDYKVILSLIKALQNGAQTKEEADALIDRSSALQNLREAIEPLKDRAATATDAHRAEQASERGKDYLYRYYRLITVDAYLHDPAAANQSFSQWMQSHPELQVSRQNLELAMGLSHPGSVALA